MSRVKPVVPNPVAEGTGGASEDRPDMSPRSIQTYMIGVFLAVNAIRDVHCLVEGPDCVHMKTQFVQGNHDWLSTLTSVSGFHRIANTALHPVHMTGSREEHLADFLVRMASHEAVHGLLFTSMPMAFITGADYERLCDDVATKTGKPMVHVKGKSLSGDWLDGYSEVLLSMAKQLDIEDGELDPNEVAIIGNLFDRNEGDHRGNVRALRDMMSSLGLKTACVWLEGGDFADLTAVKNAGVVVSLPYGRRAAKRIARRTGARLIEGELPFGLGASERFMRKLGEELGRENEADAYIDRQLSEVIPSLEFVIPFVFQNRKWGYVGDPFLAPGIADIAETVGSRLVFAVITNMPRHVGALEKQLAPGTKMCVFPRQNTMNEFVNEACQDDAISLIITHSDGAIMGEAATFEFGYPSMFRHCLYDRPFLGFQGFLAVVDSMANEMRRQEVADNERRHRQRSERSKGSRPSESDAPSDDPQADRTASPAPPEPGAWIEALRGRLVDRGYPVKLLVAADESLDLIFDAGGGQELTIELRPHREGARAYESTERFLVSYCGVRHLSPAMRRLVDRLVSDLPELENAIPVSRHGVVSAGETDEGVVRSFERRFYFAELDRSHGDDGIETEVLVRLTPNCNQDCAFCSAPEFRKPSPRAVRDCIDWVAERLPGARLTLTGGEPTLRATFPEELAYALGHDEIGAVLVQTNAVQFSKPEKIDQLPDDDRLSFFVSLHAMDAAIYDRCTASKDQLPLAIEGIRRLAATGRRITLNCVVTSENLAHLPDLVEALPALFAERPKPVLHFSALICPPHRPRAPDFLVRYSEVTPVFEAARRRATELGFEVQSLVSSTHASIPLCLASESDVAAASHRPELGQNETGYEDLDRDWAKAERCRGCTVTDRCLGVPTAYAKRFGLDELRPF